ncbi:MAG: hypothetical protein ACXVLT_13045 [Flavisolibacter sp.]
MKSGIRFLKVFPITVVLLVLSVLSGCKKSSTDSLGGVPRKDVPDPFVGTFVYVTTSGGWVDQIGSTTVGVAEGVTLQINKNGTGSWLYSAQSGSYTGAVTTDEVYANCTYEITEIDDSHANIVIHTINGKDYHDHVYLHDLDASKIYPNNDFVYNNVLFGKDSQGTDYFTIGSGSTASTFTRQ